MLVAGRWVARCPLPWALPALVSRRPGVQTCFMALHSTGMSVCPDVGPRFPVMTALGQFISSKGLAQPHPSRESWSFARMCKYQDIYVWDLHWRNVDPLDWKKWLVVMWRVANYEHAAGAATWVCNAVMLCVQGSSAADQQRQHYHRGGAQSPIKAALTSDTGHKLGVPRPRALLTNWRQVQRFS